MCRKSGSQYFHPHPDCWSRPCPPTTPHRWAMQCSVRWDCGSVLEQHRQPPYQRVDSPLPGAGSFNLLLDISLSGIYLANIPFAFNCQVSPPSPLFLTFFSPLQSPRAWMTGDPHRVSHLPPLKSPVSTSVLHFNLNN